MKRCLIVLFVLGVMPISAQTTFEPTVSASASYTDNVAYNGTGASSDTAYVLSAVLPVTKDWKSGSLTFLYSPSAYRYDSAPDALDRIDHRATFGVQSQLSRKSNLKFNFNFSRSQTQGTFTNIEDPDIILTQRADRDLYSSDLGYDRQIGQRWNWNFSVGGGTADYESIPGFTGPGLQGRDYVRFSTGAANQISKKTSVGFNVGLEEVSLDGSGDEEIQSANAVVLRQIDQVSSINLSAGYYTTESTIVGSPDRSGLNLRFGYNRTFRSIALTTFLGHQPTTGGNLPGTATVTNLGVAISSARSVKWSWNLNAVGAQRDPSDPLEMKIDSLGYGGGVGWNISRKFSLALQASQVKQDSIVPMTPDTEVFSANFGVVWKPKG